MEEFSSDTLPHSGNGSQNRPLILLTNDDGIHSPGLHAVVRAVCDLGDLYVAAPRQQYSNAGRSYAAARTQRTDARQEQLPVNCPNVVAYSLAGSPAQSVMRAIVDLVPRRPDLLISGINYGENMGVGVTVSGTIGAAIEGACAGIPGLAVSLQTPHEFHYNHSDTVDFSAAATFTRKFAQLALAHRLPPDVDILKIDVPEAATADSPWQLTRISRQRYYVATPKHKLASESDEKADYEVQIDMATLEPDSDIRALAVDRVVSVSPLSIDLSSRVDRKHTEDLIRRSLETLKEMRQ
jgi:5'-nucleotidase